MSPRRPLSGLVFIVTLLIGGAAARPALAQSSGTWLNLGVGITSFQSTDSAGHSNNFGIGVAWRLGHPKTGWSPSVGFNWYETTLELPIVGQPTRLGSIHVRPIMAGYGYTRRLGRTAIGAKVAGGYAFNNLSVNNALRQAYLNDFDTWVSGNIANSWVVMPQAGVWYDLTSRVGVNVSLGYLLNRPIVTLTTATARTHERWNADMVTLSFGVVYGVF